MSDFLNDLADVLEKHNGGILYTQADDGIYVMQGEDNKKKYWIGFPYNGRVADCRRVAANLKTQDK